MCIGQGICTNEYGLVATTNQDAEHFFIPQRVPCTPWQLITTPNY